MIGQYIIGNVIINVECVECGFVAQLADDKSIFPIRVPGRTPVEAMGRLIVVVSEHRSIPYDVTVAEEVMA